MSQSYSTRLAMQDIQRTSMDDLCCIRLGLHMNCRKSTNCHQRTGSQHTRSFPYRAPGHFPGIEFVVQICCTARMFVAPICVQVHSTQVEWKDTRVGFRCRPGAQPNTVCGFLPIQVLGHTRLVLKNNLRPYPALAWFSAGLTYFLIL